MKKVVFLLLVLIFLVSCITTQQQTAEKPATTESPTKVTTTQIPECSEYSSWTPEEMRLAKEVNYPSQILEDEGILKDIEEDKKDSTLSEKQRLYNSQLERETLQKLERTKAKLAKISKCI